MEKGEDTCQCPKGYWRSQCACYDCVLEGVCNRETKETGEKGQKSWHFDPYDDCYLSDQFMLIEITVGISLLAAVKHSFKSLQHFLFGSFA